MSKKQLRELIAAWERMEKSRFGEEETTTYQTEHVRAFRDLMHDAKKLVKS